MIMPLGSSAPLRATSAIDPSQMGDCKANPITINAVDTAGVNRSGHATRDLVSSSSIPKPCLLRFLSVRALSLVTVKVLPLSRMSLMAAIPTSKMRRWPRRWPSARRYDGIDTRLRSGRGSGLADRRPEEAGGDDAAACSGSVPQPGCRIEIRDRRRPHRPWHRQPPRPMRPWRPWRPRRPWPRHARKSHSGHFRSS